MSTNRPDPEFIPCNAARLAPAASAWLATGSPARPYHIFEEVCNLINTEGDVLSLMRAPVEMNPLALEFNAPIDFRRYLTPQSEIRLGEDTLFVGNLAIGLSFSSLWDPRPDWAATRRHWSEVEQLVGDLASTLIAEHAAESLAVFAAPDALDNPMEGWQERARMPIRRLLHALSAGDLAGAGDFAMSLAGLGMGLTPGGDDFIIGVMHALWCTIPARQVASVCTTMAQSAAPRTNQLSTNYLARAALGEASEPWHALIAALAHEDRKGLRAPFAALRGLGHTSGQDALSGFLLAITHLDHAAGS